jgi:hypothetical protein
MMMPVKKELLRLGGILLLSFPVLANAVCPNGEERLPETGLCKSQALAYIQSIYPAPPAGIVPEGCRWTVNEGSFIENYLLYHALSCKGKTATLEGGAGAHAAEINLLWSAISNAEEEERYMRIISLDGYDPKQRILMEASGDMTAVEQKNCHVRSESIQGWSTGALVVDDKPEGYQSSDGPRSACGVFGYNEGESSHWRITKYGGAFLTPRADAYQDVDLASLTVLERSSNGGWVVAKEQFYPAESKKIPAEKASVSKSLEQKTDKSPIPVKFARGAFSAIVTGRLKDFNDNIYYSIEVGNGQQMTVEQIDRVANQYVSIWTEQVPAGSAEDDLDASCHSRRSFSPTKAGIYIFKVTECQKADPWNGNFSLKFTVRDATANKEKQDQFAKVDFYKANENEAGMRKVKCRLKVKGKTYLDGKCMYSSSKGGSFSVFGKHYFAYLNILGDGKASLSWNESPEHTKAQALLGEDFSKKGGCWVNANKQTEICAWSL